MAQGLEDSAYWNHPSRQKPIRTDQHCRRCSKKLGGRHCASAECPWCATCGEKVNFSKK